MQREIQGFISYMREVRKAANNTVISYERDLQKMRRFMEEQGIHSSDKVTSTDLDAYILHLEGSGMSNATVSRTVAALRRFFDYQCKHGGCTSDPSETLRAPRVEKKTVRSVKLSREDLVNMMETEPRGPKQLRDKAMLLAMSQGVRASEIVSLRLEDMNLEMGYLTVKGERQTRTVKVEQLLLEALVLYLEEARTSLLRGKESEMLFVNCNGGHLSRQGVWKVVKYYGQQIGMPDLTPDGLRMPMAAEV